MNRMNREHRIRVVAALVEGNSVRGTARMMGVSKNTVLKLLVDTGYTCSLYQHQNLRGLTTQRVECDEIWSFVGAKAKNVRPERATEFGVGDVWTWTAIDADSKLVLSWLVGDRSGATATVFMRDVAARLSSRVQLTTDGHRAYLEAVEDAFGADIDYAILIKIYGRLDDDERRYSPPTCTGIETQKVMGDPDEAHISTSYVERQNLTMRMSMRRFTRLTNAFSKKVENHAAAISLHFMHYNFVRPHMTLKGRTPAMAAGLTDHQWAISDIVELLEAQERGEFVIGQETGGSN